MGGLVELLCVERGTEAESDTRAEEDIVGDGSNTTVVDLGLFWVSDMSEKNGHISKICRDVTNLGEGDGIQAVLASDLEADSVAGLGVPGSLGTSLGLAVDLVVVAGGEDTQVARGSDSGRVLGSDEADSSAVAGDGSLLDIVASLGTSEEALVADDGIDVGSGALEEVEESTAVEGGLLEGEVELGALVLGGGEEGEDALGLEALRNAVGELDLGVEVVGSVPDLGQGEACASIDD